MTSRKCDVKWKDGKYTALHIAVKFVKPDNVQLLVSRGAGMYIQSCICAVQWIIFPCSVKTCSWKFMVCEVHRPQHKSVVKNKR